MTVRVPPNAEAVVTAYLNANEQLLAVAPGAVVSQTPVDQTQAWIKAALVNPQPDGTLPVLHLIEAQIQFDCYGSDNRAEAKSEASLVARTLQAVLADIANVTQDDAVMTSVRFGAMPYIPDPSGEPARARYILDAFVTMHPTPES